MHDFVAEFLRFCVGAVDVVGADRNDRVLPGGRIARYQLDYRPAIRRTKPGHPAHVEHLAGQSEIIALETLGCLDVGHSEIGENFGC
jgi:hypothetical protein